MKGFGEYFKKEFEIPMNNLEGSSLEDLCAFYVSNVTYFHQQKKIDKLEKELDQQRFNNKNNLSIDQKISDHVKRLEKENNTLLEENEAYMRNNLYDRLKEVEDILFNASLIKKDAKITSEYIMKYNLEGKK